MKPKTIMTVQELIDSLQNCTKDSRIFLAILPLNEAAGIVGVQNCDVLDFETRQMAPVVFLGIKNFSALAHAKFDVKTSPLIAHEAIATWNGLLCVAHRGRFIMRNTATITALMVRAIGVCRVACAAA